MLRALPPLARQLVMRLAYLDAPTDVSQWISTKSKVHADKLAEALARMRQVHILSDVDARAVQLNSTFRDQLRLSLTQRDTSPWSEGRNVCDRSDVQPDQLRQWAQSRWESLLHYMVSPDEHTRPEEGWKISKEVKDELISAGRDGSSLMDSAPGASKMLIKYEISAAGFQFLLRPLRAQVWQLLMDIVYRRRKQGKNKENRTQADELLTSVFQLSFCTLGAGYSMDLLSNSQQELMKLLGLLGLVYFRANAPRRFYPTHLILDTGSSSSSTSSRDAAEGSAGSAAKASSELKDGRCVIVETNYRVYAYTSSMLQEQVLRLFSTIVYKLPYLLIAIITRTSIRGALVRGISARQIIDYLHMHAHPQCIESGGAVVPEVVTDQIKFWEQERRRIRSEAAVAFTDFSREVNWAAVKREAEKLLCVAPPLPPVPGGGAGVTPEMQVEVPKSSCLYADKNESIVVVSASSDQEIRSFIQTLEP